MRVSELRLSRAPAAVFFAIALGVAAQHALAAPFEFRRATPLGRPAKPAALVVQQREQAVVLEAEQARVELPLANPQRVDVQLVTVGGGAFAVVRVTGADGHEAAALLGRNRRGRVEVLWSGALDMRGDPGERVAGSIEIKDQTGDGQPDVVVGQLSERARVCGDPPAVLYPRAVDPASLGLRPVTLARAATAQAASAEVEASAQSPGPSQPPILKALRVAAVSSQPGMESQLAVASLPSALSDGDASTFWSTDNRGGDRGEFVTLQWSGGAFAVRALALVPLPTGLPADRAAASVRALWIVGDDGTRIKVRLPATPEAGRRYWIALDKPRAWHCVSLVIEESAPLRKEHPGPALLAEVEAYTELDFGGGFDQLVQDLAASGARAGEAAHLLSSAGPAALPTLRAAWPKLPSPARRRAVRVLADHAAREASARELLAAALDDADAEVRSAAFAALLAAGPEARATLLPRTAQANAQGDAAATALARQAPREALPALLAALASEHGSERPILREAVELACQNGGAESLPIVRAWSESNAGNVAARAALALALSRAKSMNPLAAELIAADVAHAERFEDRWRLVQAARALTAETGVDAWLAALAKDDDHWMLRAAALAALAERSAPQRSDVALAALADPYPRVRAQAADVLAAEPSAREPLIQHATRDTWPLVRAAALESLASQPGNESVLRKGIGDPHHQVRAAAVRALTKAHVRDAWPEVEGRLKSDGEWPEVTAEAIRYAATLCVREAGPQLMAALQRGIKPDAWEPDVDNALLAFDALMRLGGADAKAALETANLPISPEVFKTAARTQQGKPAACTAAR